MMYQQKTRKPKSKLRLMRMKHGLTATELAELMGLTPGSVCNQEQRGIRNTDMAERYAAVLYCKPEELLEFKTPSRA